MSSVPESPNSPNRSPLGDHITVCICTYRRPELLTKLLTAVSRQRTDGRFTISCAVVDNDADGSGRAAVDDIRRTVALDVEYVIEPEKNFAIARNRAVDLAHGPLLAFIDDDEVPEDDWLLQLTATMEKCEADAVLGPVRPYFEEEPPAWIVKSRICERPAHPTGMVLHWRQARTGNVLLRTSIMSQRGVRFDPAFGTGGEDVDFFRRAAAAGCRFVWCEEAPAYELVPPARLTRGYYLRRALLQGSVSLRYAADSPSLVGRLRVAGKAAFAVVVYTLALPFLFLAGDHLGMKYLIKNCHHFSRLLAMAGISNARVRNF